MDWIKKFLDWLFGWTVPPMDPVVDEEAEPPLSPDEPQPA